MPPSSTDLPAPRLLFTAPWEPVVVRRGDALGLRGLAEVFAEAVAPGLTNRVADGRWVTILSWCLARSHEVFHAAGGSGGATRAQQSQRYAWLRPLELMWVARAVLLGADEGKNRQLPGQRRVRRWLNDDRPAERFGMTTDQYRSYRQTGAYGAYRVAFRAWQGLTVGGDGWTPGPRALGLADWLDDRLGNARPPWPLHAGGEDGPSGRSVKRAESEARWWLQNWPSFDEGGRNTDASTLPRRWDDFGTLPEAKLLRPLIFGPESGSGVRRMQVAHAVGECGEPGHLGLCGYLARVFLGDPVIRLLPAFSRLADAGTAVMDFVAGRLRDGSSVPLAHIASRAEAPGLCAELAAAARGWVQAAVGGLRHAEAAHRFAAAFPNADPTHCLRELLRHHELHGGGLRWFVLRGDRVEPRAPQRGASSRYRFRLWSLVRLAVQCGEIGEVPLSLRAGEAEIPEAGDE